MKKYKIQLLSTLSVMSLMFACSGGSSDSDDDTSAATTTTTTAADGTTTTTTKTAYEHQIAPGALALALPSSITIDKSSTTSLSLAEEPGTSESKGYSEITEKIRRVQTQLAELSLNNAMLDRIYVEKCPDFSGSCTVADPCSKVSSEVINSLESAMGEEQFGDSGPLGGLDKKLDAEVCFKSITISSLTDDPEGFDLKAEIKIDDNNSITQFWTNDTENKKVKVVNAFQDSFDDFSVDLDDVDSEDIPDDLTDALGGDAAGDAGDIDALGGDIPTALALTEESSAPVFKGTSTFIYDPATKNFKATNKFSMTFGNETNQGEETFTIQGISDKEDSNGIVLKGKIVDEFSGNTWSLQFEGKADNDGGFVRTQSSYSNYTVTEATLSAACESGAEYWFYPGGTNISELSGDDMFFKQLGSFTCDEASKTLNGESVFIFGQIPSDASGLVLAKITWPGFDDAAGGADAGGADAGGADAGGADDLGDDAGDAGAGDADDLGDLGDDFSGSFLTLEEDVDDFLPTLAAASFTFSTIVASPSTDSICYEEEFTKEGDLTAWRAGEGKCDDASIVWSGESGDFGDDYAYDAEAEEANFQELKVSIVDSADGSDCSASAVKTASNQTDFLPEIYIFPADTPVDTYENFDNNFFEKMIGFAYAEQPDADASSEDLSQYAIDYWGAEDQIADADIYHAVISDTTGELTTVLFSSDLSCALEKEE